MPTPFSDLKRNVPSSGPSAGAKAGTGVGVSVLVVVADVTASLISTSRKSKGEKDSLSDESTPHTNLEKGKMYQVRAHAHELGSEHGYG